MSTGMIGSDLFLTNFGSLCVGAVMFEATLDAKGDGGATSLFPPGGMKNEFLCGTASSSESVSDLINKEIKTLSSTIFGVGRRSQRRDLASPKSSFSIELFCKAELGSTAGGAASGIDEILFDLLFSVESECDITLVRKVLIRFLI
jgi:hypothetical protein